MAASRRSGASAAAVSIQPPSSATRRPARRATTPYPVLARPGSMPRTIMCSGILRRRADASPLTPRVVSSDTVPDWEAEGLLEGLNEDERRERSDLLDYLHDEIGTSIERLKEGDPALLVAIPAERHVGGEPRYTPRE